MADHFEILIRSILIRPDKSAVLLLGHFSPQTHQTRGFAGPDHWHNIVAQFYDVPHVSVKSALFPTTCGILSLSRSILSIPCSPARQGMNLSRRYSWRTSKGSSSRRCCRKEDGSCRGSSNHERPGRLFLVLFPPAPRRTLWSNQHPTKREPAIRRDRTVLRFRKQPHQPLTTVVVLRLGLVRAIRVGAGAMR